jgi:hypothetical protein
MAPKYAVRFLNSIPNVPVGAERLGADLFTQAYKSSGLAKVCYLVLAVTPRRGRRDDSAKSLSVSE